MGQTGDVCAFSAVLLAGGYSRRMGRDKALLPLAGRTLLEHQLATLHGLGAGEVILSCRPDQEYPVSGVRVIHDVHCDRGPLGAIASCLAEATYEVVVVLAVDMPAMTSGYLRGLLGGSAGSVIPVRADGTLEPLAAVYRRVLLPAALACLQREELAVRAWIGPAIARGDAGTRRIEEHEERLFANWNTPASTFGGA